MTGFNCLERKKKAKKTHIAAFPSLPASYFAQPVGVVRSRTCQLTRVAELTLTGAKRFRILVWITKVRHNKMKQATKKNVTPVLFEIWANLFFLSALLLSNWLCCGCLQSARLVSFVPSATCCSERPKCWHSWLKLNALPFIHTVHTSVFALDQLGFNICWIHPVVHLLFCNAGFKAASLQLIFVIIYHSSVVMARLAFFLKANYDTTTVECVLRSRHKWKPLFLNNTPPFSLESTPYVSTHWQDRAALARLY